MLRTIIVDDEKNARINIVNLINTYCSNLEVIALADCVSDGLKKIQQHKPDLVLLDIDMPDGTGFDLLQKLMPIDFQVIFITAHSEHALRAIRFNALEFLTKPVDPEDFIIAINKAMKNINQLTPSSSLPHVSHNNHQDLHTSEHAPAETQGLSTMMLNRKLENMLSRLQKNYEPGLSLGTTDAVYFVEPKDIIRIEADSNYSSFYLNDNRKIMVSKPLKEYDELLGGYGFFRSHQSHLINLAYLKEFQKKDGGYVVLSNNESVPVSTRKKDKLLEAYQSFKGW